jgi:CBS domain-containing protein
MSERTVQQSMSRRHVLSLGPSASVHDAACAMTRANCGSVLIIDSAGTMQGILTERDLMTRVLARSLDANTTTVTQVLTRSPQCVGPEVKVAEAALDHDEGGFRHLPIVEPGGRVVGVFSARDALPREVNTAVDLAEFNEQVNDALG